MGLCSRLKIEQAQARRCRRHRLNLHSAPGRGDEPMLIELNHSVFAVARFDSSGVATVNLRSFPPVAVATHIGVVQRHSGHNWDSTSALNLHGILVPLIAFRE